VNIMNKPKKAMPVTTLIPAFVTSLKTLSFSVFVSCLSLPTLAIEAQLSSLLKLTDQGIRLDTSLLGGLTSKDSDVALMKLYNDMLTQADTGVLDKSMVQPSWLISDVAQYNKMLEPLQVARVDIDKYQSQLPQYKQLSAALDNLIQWRNHANDRIPDDVILGYEDPKTANDKSRAYHKKYNKILQQWLFDLSLLQQVNDDYSDELSKQMTDIQLKFRLSPDGRYGKNTRRAILALTNERIELLKINLERLRWLPQRLPYPHVLVDIAGFKVSWHPDAKTQIITKAIIGQKHKQTPIFEDKIEAITVNPRWKVPHSIAKSILKSQQKDENYLTDNEFEVYADWKDNAPKVDPSKVTWSTVTPTSLRYRFEQLPGDQNALGRFKLNLANKFGIYLHDTNHKELFSNNKRALSSGCTRVEGIDQLLLQILAQQKMSIELDPILEEGKTKKVKLAKAVPIYFLYFTAWPDEFGQINYREDVYKKDEGLKGWF
jgi:L,D-transpeptidase YcbB